MLMDFKLLESIKFWGVHFHMHVYACGICSPMDRFITYVEGRGGCWVSYSTIFHLESPSLNLELDEQPGSPRVHTHTQTPLHR